MRVIVLSIVLALSAAPVFAADAGPASQPVTKVVNKADTSVEMPEGVPQDMDEALEAAKTGVEFAKAKNWWGLSAICIFVLMFILKLVGVFKKIGKRWAYILVPVLSLAAMLLSKFAGDLSWGAAIAVLTSGPAMAMLSDFIKRGILGKEHTTFVNGN